MKRFVREYARTVSIVSGVAIAVLVSYVAGVGCTTIPTVPSSSPHDKNYRFVIPRTSGTSPVIDGTTAPGGMSDAGWNGAAKFDLDQGSNVPAGQMWTIADNSNVYLYFEIEAQTASSAVPLFNSQDVLVLLLGPNAAGGDYRRLHIFPCKPNAHCTSNSLNQALDATGLVYYTGTYSGGAYTWNSPEPISPSFDAKVATATGTCDMSGCAGKWAVEVKIPRADFGIGDSDFFGLYVDLAETNPDTGDAWQYTWPHNRIIGGSPGAIVSQLQVGTPTPEQWGLATLSTAIGNGVYLSSSDIRTNQANPSEISLNAENRFYADVHNNLLVGGTLADAQSVRATFEFTNFGLGNGWNSIPTGGPGVVGAINPNPTARGNIPATGSRLYEIGPWALTAAEQGTYGANPHYCVRVTLDSTDPDTLFFTNQVQANMDFVVTHSPFPMVAFVGAGDADMPKGKIDHEVVLNEYFYNIDPKQEWQSKIGLDGKGKRYVARVKNGESRRFESSINPPKMTIPRTLLKMNANAEKSIQVPARSGEIVTLLVHGSVTLRKEQGKRTDTGPAGRDFTRDNELFDQVYRGVLNKDQKGGVSKPRAFTLASKFAPQTRVGALVGSWDDFRESSFVIGEAATLKVPSGAEKLSLAINDVSGASALRGGDGYKVEVIATPAKDYFSFANPAVSRDSARDSVKLPVGANLPTWIMRGARDSGKVIVIDGKTFRALEPMGSFGAVVTDIGP